MQKSLYLLCPTDCLESIINSTFNNKNYFYTSLGNSVMFDNKQTLKDIKELIKKHEIRDISFVLSNTNKIILDALGNKDFLKIRGLNDFYNKITEQKEHSVLSWHTTDNRQFSILSYYLNKKIKELQLELNSLFFEPIRIHGKIYNKKENMFNNIYSDLICIEKYCLN